MASCNGKPGCPVADAMRMIVGGGYVAGETCRLVIRGGVDETVHHVGAAAFRATIAKLEYARAAMQGVPYEGELQALAGKDVVIAVCWLLGDSVDTLTNALCDIACSKWTAGGCALYPNFLMETVNGALPAGMAPLPPPPHMPTGVLPNDIGELADMLLKLSVQVSDIEAYQLLAAQKAIDIYESRAADSKK